MYQVAHSGKDFACQCRRCKRHGFYPWGGKITQRRKWQPTLVFLPGKFHRQRSLVDYGPWITKSRTQLSDLACTHTVPLYNVIKLCHERCYSFSSIHCLALASRNLMTRYTAPCTMTLVFWKNHFVQSLYRKTCWCHAIISSLSFLTLCKQTSKRFWAAYIQFPCQFYNQCWTSGSDHCI